MIQHLRPHACRPVALVALLVASLSAPAMGTAAQDRDWVVLPLPIDARAADSGGTSALLDGRHLFLSGGPVARDVTLGPLVPGRAAEEIVWRAVQEIEGSSATVDVLSDSILIRGSSEARAAGTAALQALTGDLEALHFDLRATLVATTVGGEKKETVFDETRRVRSGSTASFGERSESTFVADYDVEVANEIAIADPVIGTLISGETVHLWVSSFVDESGVRRVFVQGLLDIARIDKGTQFETDVFELGPITQPVVHATQVLFAGVADRFGTLSVHLSGLGGDLPGRDLQIRAVPSAATSNAVRIVDLGRGLWRGRLVAPHAIFEADRGLDVGTGPSPASLSQLFFATVGRTPGARPVLADAIVIFDPTAAGTAAAMRTLAEELDPTGSTARVLVTMAGVTAKIPATEGTLLRVSHTRETSYVADYDPQLASQAALSDPISRIAISGVAIEGVVRAGVLVGQAVDLTVSTTETMDLSAADLGRIQMVTRRRVLFRLRVRPGEAQRLRAGEVQSPRTDFTVEWEANGGIDSPR